MSLYDFIILLRIAWGETGGKDFQSKLVARFRVEDVTQTRREDITMNSRARVEIIDSE